jgi:hypothetical protein
MFTKKIRRNLLAAISVGVLTAGLLAVAGTASQSVAAAGAVLNVNLASSQGPATGVGEGFLYGVSQDGTQPSDALLQPLRFNAFRGGGHVTRGWIGDGYQYGTGTRTDVNTVIAQARRFTQPPYNAQYQVILSDLYGNDGGQPSNTRYPCSNGDCSNWVAFLDAVVGALQDSGLPFAYDIYNEPDISVFWPNGSVNSTQYFQMWDTAYRELRRLAPNALIVGPSFAFTPQARSSQWKTFLSHVKAAGTVPDWITNHDEGDVDDPVTVAQSINNVLTSSGVPLRPLSANEYQPADRQTAGVTAWYLARFAQSGYSNAMRGNWSCCLSPNLTGVLTQSNGTWVTSGNWWVMRSYADLTGTLVDTSRQVGSTAISASVDSAAKRAVAVIGDSNGFTGGVTVNVNGLSSQPWLSGSGSVRVVVHRIPEQASLASPQVVFNQDISASSGALSVPLTFQASHDAFAIYLTPGGGTVSPSPTPSSSPPATSAQIVGTGSGRCVAVPGGNTANGTQVQLADCGSEAGQRWTYTAGKALVVYGNKCLDASGQGSADGTAVIIWDCNGQTNQQWTVESSGTVTGVQSGKCLDAYGAGTTAGTKITLWSCHGGSNQRWTLRA